MGGKLAKNDRLLYGKRQLENKTICWFVGGGKDFLPDSSSPPARQHPSSTTKSFPQSSVR